MFFINFYNILNSIDKTLEKNNRNYTNSFIDNFINDLKSYFRKIDSLKKLEELPKENLFTLDRYEGEYAVCENRDTGEMFDIPKTKISPSAKEGDILRLKDNLYQIDFEETLKTKETIDNLVNTTFSDKN